MEKYLCSTAPAIIGEPGNKRKRAFFHKKYPPPTPPDSLKFSIGPDHTEVR